MVTKVQASLDRIRAEAVKKAREGIAKQYNSKQVEQFVQSLQLGIKSPIATDISKRVSSKVVDKFLTLFENNLTSLQVELSQEREFPSALRNAAGEILMYPEGCRFMNEVDNFGTMVIEQPPQIRTLLVEEEIEEKYKTNKRYIPLPYVVLVVYYHHRPLNPVSEQYVFRGLAIGFRNKPITSLEDVLLTPALPNCGGNSICLGDYDDDVHYADSPIKIANDVINYLWQSVFNETVLGFIVRGKEINTLEAWEALGEKNPLDILEAEFIGGASLRTHMMIDKSNLTQKETQSLSTLISQTWSQIATGLKADDAQELIRSCSQEILEKLIADLALQPKKL